MITFRQAIDLVLGSSLKLPCEDVPLWESTGRVLAVDISADRDMPPFNKSAVDGFTCKRSDLFPLGDGQQEMRLAILETIPAGYRPTMEIKEGECSRIMTGAVVPNGADYVLMVEDSEVEDGCMKIRAGNKNEKGVLSAARGSNICYKGEDIKQGETIIKSGTTIGAAQVGVLAGAGVCSVRVSTRPKVGVLSTGDEIVEPHITPLDYQIRDSNGAQLTAQAKSCADAKFYGIVKDGRDELFTAIQKASSECDILILTGGVSMGEFDYVPQVLTECGFKILFDRIAVQPGKPSTFGVKERSGSERTAKVVFALPGNPVSSYIQFEMLVRPFIIKSMGGDYFPKSIMLPCATDYKRRNSERTALIPVTIEKNGTFMPVNYNGSAHILAMTLSDGVAMIPTGINRVQNGETAEIFILK
ncbi:MAG: molybdopterin molybdotransferase MoeA [Bacteroidales bacterium]|nr:molybdopterin molybdotransferase MoeA [Bacteroidales bacterium]